MEEGYIKFECIRIPAAPTHEEKCTEINFYRSKLRTLGLIGVYPDGIGYGNISMRIDKDTFLITGSATGGLKELTPEHFAYVTEYKIAENRLTCHGQINASSESLTHAMIYESSPTTNAVIHVHSLSLWEKLMHNYPTTAPSAAYGTPEMAFELERLIKSGATRDKQLIVMSGHREGLIAFGPDLQTAYDVLTLALQT